MRRAKVIVVPTLSRADRQALSRFIQELRRARSGCFTKPMTVFNYRGSLVTIINPLRVV